MSTIIDITTRYAVQIRCIAPANVPKGTWVPINAGIDFSSDDADLYIYTNIRKDCAQGYPDLFEYRKVAL